MILWALAWLERALSLLSLVPEGVWAVALPFALFIASGVLGNRLGWQLLADFKEAQPGVKITDEALLEFSREHWTARAGLVWLVFCLFASGFYAFSLAKGLPLGAVLSLSFW